MAPKFKNFVLMCLIKFWDIFKWNLFYRVKQSCGWIQSNQDAAYQKGSMLSAFVFLQCQRSASPATEITHHLVPLIWTSNLSSEICWSKSIRPPPLEIKETSSLKPPLFWLKSWASWDKDRVLLKADMYLLKTRHVKKFSLEHLLPPI